MAQLLHFGPALPTLHHRRRRSAALSMDSSLSALPVYSSRSNQNPNWASLQLKLKCRGRYSCLFSSDNRREDQARKALEGALGGKKNEFEKWNKEIKKREEMIGGGDAGGGGWFGWRRWFGGSDGEHFWEEAQQASLAILGIIFVYLLVAKGELLLAVIFNPLLYLLRWTRNSLTFLTSLLLKKMSPAYATVNYTPKEEVISRPSAKENVIRKWGSD
ncbi:hypothetical protein Scep_012612 [Stephania cephalantha]|uniref:Uncharacterized protein n=1 Tax=Stephania cephalantha TaxID=152367 RepID=A0AAP0JFQ8_9MAGN